ncbi:MAG: GAF domain-containing protein [Polaromonas sp.]|nr:GAF domain-containing protein [Gemmatimonadaceae bacterium]
MAKRPELAPKQRERSGGSTEVMHGLDPETLQLLLTETFQQSPSFLAVLVGPTYVFEMANEAYFQLVGHRELIGKPIREALPEVQKQGLIELLDHVLETGVPYVGKAIPATLARIPSGEPETLYVDLAYQAITDETGARIGVLVHGNDVTAHVQANREVERLLKESRAAQEALEDANTQLEEQQAELESTNHQLQENAVELEAQAEELEVTTQDLAERMVEAEASSQRARFAGAVGEAITSGGALAAVMQRCCEAAVTHLDTAFARVWVLEPDEQMLVLTASAGLYTHLNGTHGRVPVGQFKIGQIAAERRPHLTNGVVGDPRVSDQEWATREGMVAFAGYPLPVGEELVGVMALFSRRELVAAAFEALETASTAISVAIANTKLLESERAARVAAEAASRGKSEFLSMMSHELRTPLNAIGGFAQLLEMEVRGPMSALQHDYLNRIQRAGQHLQSIIAEVLNYAHLDTGRMSYDTRDVAVETIIDDAEMLVAAQIAEHGLTLARHHDPSWAGSLHHVHADGEKARQILINLLSNATKFTAPGGRIVLSFAVAGKCVEIRVSDTGRGIKAEDLAKVFEPFVQIDRMRTVVPQQGVGLGLAISRDFARGMGGDLSATSTPGKGSTFTLSLRSA